MGENDNHRTDTDSTLRGSRVNRAIDWHSRMQSGTMTPEEMRTFEAWREASVANRRAFDKVVEFWDSAEFAQALANSENTRSDRDAVRAAPPYRSGRAVGPVALVLAAMLVLAVVISDGGYPFNAADYATNTGERISVSLPDGSVMRLNSGTAVALSFTSDRRGLELLEGEAFFDVRRDPARPFEVVAGRSLTRVVGTAFSVALVGDVSNVAVKSGKVDVAGENAPHVVRLTPGRGVTIEDGRAGTARPVDVEAIFAWLEGRFIFHDRPMPEVIAQLDRHYGGSVVLASERLRKLRISGNYRLDDPKALLSALADSVGADVVRISDYLVILH